MWTSILEVVLYINLYAKVRIAYCFAFLGLNDLLARR
jgi:hypothetical protein